MKNLCQGPTLVEKLLSGTRKLSSAVGTTLGPRGRNVLIKKSNQPHFITKDGVTVAQNFSLKDEVEEAAAQIIKQASKRTNIEAGDGTTTSAVLASAIFSNAATLVSKSSASPVEVFRGLVSVSSHLLNEMQSESVPVTTLDQIRHIATVSANNDASVGDLITMAVDSVGLGGSITIEDSNTSETTLDLIEGFRLASGFCSSSFINDERKRIFKYENPIFLITDEKLDSIDQILPSLEIAARENRPFIIVADEVEGQALAALIMNKARGTMKIAAINSPSYGLNRRAIMEDLAVATGAKFFKRENGDRLTQVSLTDFGSARSIVCSNTEAVITGVSGEPTIIAERVDSLAKEIKEVNANEAPTLVERVSNLQSGVGVIKVGGNSDSEVIERRHRIEDALEAVKSAQAEGIVPGASYMFLYARSLLSSLDIHSLGLTEEQALAVDILKNALEEPFSVMLQNSGLNGNFDEYYNFDSVKPSGLNILTGRACDLYAEGIIDPFKVVRCSLKNAVSAAGSLLTTNYSIIETDP